MSSTDWVTVRIPRRTRKYIDKILAQVSQHGWTHAGVARTDAPTIGTVLDAAVQVLADRLKDKGTP